jgi:hypothetical protein
MSAPRPVLVAATLALLALAVVIPLPLLVVDVLLVLAIALSCWSAQRVGPSAAGSCGLVLSLGAVVALVRASAADARGGDLLPAGLTELVGTVVAGGNVVIGGAITALVLLGTLVAALLRRDGRDVALVALGAAVAIVAAALLGSSGSPGLEDLREAIITGVGAGLLLLVPAFVALASGARAPRTGRTPLLASAAGVVVVGLLPGMPKLPMLAIVLVLVVLAVRAGDATEPDPGEAG